MALVLVEGDVASEEEDEEENEDEDTGSGSCDDSTDAEAPAKPVLHSAVNAEDAPPVVIDADVMIGDHTGKADAAPSNKDSPQMCCRDYKVVRLRTELR